MSANDIYNANANDIQIIWLAVPIGSCDRTVHAYSIKEYALEKVEEWKKDNASQFYAVYHITVHFKNQVIWLAVPIDGPIHVFKNKKDALNKITKDQRYEVYHVTIDSKNQ